VAAREVSRGQRIGLIATLLLALAMAIAGCGGSDEATLTKNEFLLKGEAICEGLLQKQVGEMAAFYKSHGFNIRKTTRPDRELVNVAVVLPIVQEKIEKISALPAPEGDEAKIEKIVTAWRRGIRRTERDPVTLALPGPAHPFSMEEAADLAAAYGLRACVQP
jgi:hypothetical protein